MKIIAVFFLFLQWINATRLKLTPEEYKALKIALDGNKPLFVQSAKTIWSARNVDTDKYIFLEIGKSMFPEEYFGAQDFPHVEDGINELEGDHKVDFVSENFVPVKGSDKKFNGDIIHDINLLNHEIKPENLYDFHEVPQHFTNFEGRLPHLKNQPEFLHTIDVEPKNVNFDQELKHFDEDNKHLNHFSVKPKYDKLKYYKEPKYLHKNPIDLKHVEYYEKPEYAHKYSTNPKYYEDPKYEEIKHANKHFDHKLKHFDNYNKHYDNKPKIHQNKLDIPYYHDNKLHEDYGKYKPPYSLYYDNYYDRYEPEFDDIVENYHQNPQYSTPMQIITNFGKMKKFNAVKFEKQKYPHRNRKEKYYIMPGKSSISDNEILLPIYRNDVEKLSPTVVKRYQFLSNEMKSRIKRAANPQDEEEVKYAEELRFGLSTLGGLVGGAVGGYLDRVNFETSKLFSRLENLGNLGLSQFDDALDASEAKRNASRNAEKNNSIISTPVLIK